MLPKAPLDQFGTFEVFVQPREGKPFQHEGAVHAPNLEMSFVLAKETFTRRFTCTSLCVTDTRDVFVSPMTEGNVSVYDLFEPETMSSPEGKMELYEIFHLVKRGKQHVHAFQVEATCIEEAIAKAKELQSGRQGIIYNLWAIRNTAIRFTSDEEQDFWITLPDKKFRDASAYKGGDKLKEFLERN